MLLTKEIVISGIEDILSKYHFKLDTITIRNDIVRDTEIYLNSIFYEYKMKLSLNFNPLYFSFWYDVFINYDDQHFSMSDYFKYFVNNHIFIMNIINRNRAINSILC